jgi:NADPH2:quinone reductase
MTGWPSSAIRFLFRLTTSTTASRNARSRSRSGPEQARADIAELTGLFETGDLRATTESRLTLTEAARAHQLLEDRAVLGRIVLTA